LERVLVGMEQISHQDKPQILNLSNYQFVL
jgi:hypothetical protein